MHELNKYDQRLKTLLNIAINAIIIHNPFSPTENQASFIADAQRSKNAPRRFIICVSNLELPVYDTYAYADITSKAPSQPEKSTRVSSISVIVQQVVLRAHE